MSKATAKKRACYVHCLWQPLAQGILQSIFACVLLQDNFIMFTITHECPSKGATQFYSLAAQLLMEQLVNLGVPGIQRLLTDI